ncbi:superoxide dismutase [Cu-Zn], chloroplastic-like [Belonocnema kinseyi]|uniref:superoxide dismutase [Cu-Zn], chloroplastic-like n=1 Tax=Belonocnema kinseyi TaxID=2817044 RepID=UPI00143DA250|nr:superoxide dismutase [Cu-Zn], chloroplastic-like [Belonocnema kinseyi]XP_033225483.1 superoxide dismutase [Cu-Zn], chloroplastic-like [Belonocnema kinseyi]XP_033225484.1 superoxide dismutase [Cu-Zn], chloroplastic-like [Belonocnema kinseyi]
MIKVISIVVAIAAVAIAEELNAVVLLVPNDVAKNNVTGKLLITQSVANGPVTITGTAVGLDPGLHGFHVHEKGDLSGGCASTGKHFNPDKVSHGAPEDTVRHVGDLGNIKADEKGIASINITDNIISLCGPNSIIGRSFVIHEKKDDLGKGNTTLSLETGDAGNRLACGLVGIL